MEPFASVTVTWHLKLLARQPFGIINDAKFSIAETYRNL